MDAHLRDQAWGHDECHKTVENYDFIEQIWGKGAFLTEAVAEQYRGIGIADNIFNYVQGHYHSRQNWAVPIQIFHYTFFCDECHLLTLEEVVEPARKIQVSKLICISIGQVYIW